MVPAMSGAGTGGAGAGEEEEVEVEEEFGVEVEAAAVTTPEFEFSFTSFAPRLRRAASEVGGFSASVSLCFCSFRISFVSSCTCR